VSGAAFGLYPSRGLAAGQRIAAGQVTDLDTPVDDGGVKLFRKSYWLPVPALLATAQAVRLAASEMQLRFAPLRFSVGTDNLTWFPDVRHLSASDARIEFAWPAQVVRVANPVGALAHAIDLLRADGDAVAAEPVMSGATGSDLAQPWVGSPLVVRVGQVLVEVGEIVFIATEQMVKAAAAPRAGRAAPAPSEAPAGAAMPIGVTAFARMASALVPALTFAGSPTSPRVKLFAERDGGDMLLWQALMPGEQGTVTLPAGPVADEWAPALEQLRALAADPAGAPALLRLDIESDAPCRVTALQLQLALEADFELLAEPQKLSFGGAQSEQALLPLALPAGAAAEALTLAGRVVADGDADAAAGAAPADGRRGALLAADQTALQPLDLAQPASIAGLAIFWQPLSDLLQLRLRLLADGGNGPGARVLAERAVSFDTPQAGWLALRWPAIDLQAQRVWAELAVVEGAGLWLFGSGGATGWVDLRATPAQRQPLPEGLALQPIAPPAEGSAERALAVTLGDQTVAATLPVGALQLAVPKAMLPLLATHPLAFTGGVRGSVTLESARLAVRVQG